jgi:hypothetical protein
MGKSRILSDLEEAVGKIGPYTKYQVKTSNYDIVESDRGSLIDCSPTTSTMTLTLPNANSLSNGFIVTILCSGKTITILPTPAINTAIGVVISVGNTIVLYSTGTEWKILSLSGFPVLGSTDVNSPYYTNSEFYQFASGGMLVPGTTKSIGNGKLIWSNDGGVYYYRGAYHNVLFSSHSDGTGGYYYVNDGNTNVSIGNPFSKGMNFSFSVTIYSYTDDYVGLQLRKDGVTISSIVNHYMGRGNTATFDLGTHTVSSESTNTFALYASITSGGNYDAIYLNSFTSTFVGFA